MRKAAVDAYAHALEFVYGSPVARSVPDFDPATYFGAARPGEKPKAAYRRWARTSEAVAWYMSTAMVPRSGNRIPKTATELPRGLDEMRERLRQHVAMKLGKTNPDLRALLSDDVALAKLRDPIFDDHEAVRKMILFGSWTVRNGVVTGYDSTRDPCHGFLSIREEIAVALKAAGTRWGAIDFGVKESGDVMHFDITSRPAVTVDANPSRLTFARS